jgi:hypothetical protein
MPGHIDNKTLKLKHGYIHATVRGVLTAMIWKDWWGVCKLTYVHKLPAEGNFCDEHRRAHKPAIIEDIKHLHYFNILW